MVMAKGAALDYRGSCRAAGDGSFPRPGSRHDIRGNRPIAGLACPNRSAKLPGRAGVTQWGRDGAAEAAAQTQAPRDLGVALGPGQGVAGLGAKGTHSALPVLVGRVLSNAPAPSH